MKKRLTNLASRKFLLAAATAAVMLIAVWTGKDLSWEEASAIIAPVAIFIGAESWIDRNHIEK